MNDEAISQQSQSPEPSETEPSEKEAPRTITLSINRVVHLLKEGQICEQHGRVRWSSNATFLLTLRDGDMTTPAIYKPRSGERPLWDFPGGTLCNRETAAFLVSECLAWQIVPPTVLREGPHGIGSLQLYIPHDPEITYFNLGDSFLPQIEKMAYFDYITNNADRKGGHCLLSFNGKLWGIDHGLCFNVVPKLRTVIWTFVGKPLPDDLRKDIENLIKQCQSKDTALYKQLQQLINRREFESMLKRVRKLLDTGKFPSPEHHGPLQPWPPI